MVKKLLTVLLVLMLCMGVSCAVAEEAYTLEVRANGKLLQSGFGITVFLNEKLTASLIENSTGNVVTEGVSFDWRDGNNNVLSATSECTVNITGDVVLHVTRGEKQWTKDFYAEDDVRPEVSVKKNGAPLSDGDEVTIGDVLTVEILIEGVVKPDNSAAFMWTDGNDNIQTDYFAPNSIYTVSSEDFEEGGILKLEVVVPTSFSVEVFAFPVVVPQPSSITIDSVSFSYPKDENGKLVFDKVQVDVEYTAENISDLGAELRGWYQDGPGEFGEYVPIGVLWANLPSGTDIDGSLSFTVDSDKFDEHEYVEYHLQLYSNADSVGDEFIGAWPSEIKAEVSVTASLDDYLEFDGESTVQYKESYGQSVIGTLKVKEECEGSYLLPETITVTVGGEELNENWYNYNSGEVKIIPAFCTGDIVITAAAEKLYEVNLPDNLTGGRLVLMVDKKYEEGHVAQVNYYCDDGYRLLSFEAYDSDGNRVGTQHFDDPEQQFFWITMPASDVTVAARFTDGTYTITFDANGGEGEMEPFTVVEGQQGQYLPLNTFTREGYRFMTWMDSDRNVYTDGQLMDDSTFEGTLYAQWEQLPTTVIVKLWLKTVDEDGVEITKPVNVGVGEAATISNQGTAGRYGTLAVGNNPVEFLNVVSGYLAPDNVVITADAYGNLTAQNAEIEYLEEEKGWLLTIEMEKLELKVTRNGTQLTNGEYVHPGEMLVASLWGVEDVTYYWIGVTEDGEMVELGTGDVYTVAEDASLVMIAALPGLPVDDRMIQLADPVILMYDSEGDPILPEYRVNLSLQMIDEFDTPIENYYVFSIGDGVLDNEQQSERRLQVGDNPLTSDTSLTGYVKPEGIVLKLDAYGNLTCDHEDVDIAEVDGVWQLTITLRKKWTYDYTMQFRLFDENGKPIDAYVSADIGLMQVDSVSAKHGTVGTGTNRAMFTSFPIGYVEPELLVYVYYDGSLDADGAKISYEGDVVYIDLTLKSNGTTGSAGGTTAQPPKTGDSTPIGLWLVLALLSAAGMVTISRKKHKMN